MLKVPYFKQDNNFSCGPTTLQMVFAFYGKRFSESSLTERLHTKQSSGTSHGPMIEVSREEGFYVYVNNNSTIEEIATLIGRNIPVIINFIEPSSEEGHYSVVVDTTEDNMIFHDPWNGEEVKMDITTFTKRWRSEDNANLNWIMAISTKEFNTGKQYGPAKLGPFAQTPLL